MSGATIRCGKRHLWFQCTLLSGHDGDHVDIGVGGFVHDTWPNPFAAPPDPSTWFADVIATVTP